MPLRRTAERSIQEPVGPAAGFGKEEGLAQEGIRSEEEDLVQEQSQREVAPVQEQSQEGDLGQEQSQKEESVDQENRRREESHQEDRRREEPGQQGSRTEAILEKEHPKEDPTTGIAEGASGLLQSAAVKKKGALIGCWENQRALRRPLGARRGGGNIF